MPPKHAILIWADSRNIYCAPQASPEAVIAFARSTGGLAKALELLGAEHLDKAAAEPYVRPPYLPKKLAAEGLTAADIANARAALIELGILK